MIGVFQVVGEQQGVDTQTFARRHAPAILFPFLRETLAALTARGLCGPLLLQPINLYALADSNSVTADAPDA